MKSKTQYENVSQAVAVGGGEPDAPEHVVPKLQMDEDLLSALHDFHQVVRTVVINSYERPNMSQQVYRRGLRRFCNH